MKKSWRRENINDLLLTPENIGCNSFLKSISKENIDKSVFAHLNINSGRNKFELLSYMIKDNIGVLMILESKIDYSFMISIFLIDG